MQNVLLVIQCLIAAVLIFVILLQRNAQDGGGLTGGSSTMGGLFTARGSANVISRATAVLATLFILNSLSLGFIASRQHSSTSALDQIAPLAPVDAPAPDTKAAPATPAAPVAPAAPQVPMAH